MIVFQKWLNCWAVLSWCCVDTYSLRAGIRGLAKIDRVVRETVESLSGNSGLVISAFLSQPITVKSTRYIIDFWQ